MGRGFHLPPLSGSRRTVPHRHALGRPDLPQMPAPDGVDGRDRHGALAHAAERVVLGALSGRQPDARHVRRPVSAPARGLSRYETALGILHKLRAAMARPNQDRIGGQSGQHVEVDQTWVGGRTRGEGRGVHHKVLVARAVEVRHRKPGTAQDARKDGRHAGRVRLAVAPDRSAEQLCGFVETPLQRERSP